MITKPKCTAGHQVVQVCLSKACSICAFICRECKNSDSAHIHEDLIKSLPWSTFENLLNQDVNIDEDFQETVMLAETLKNTIDACVKQYAARVQKLKESLKTDEKVQEIMLKLETRSQGSITGADMKDLYKKLKMRGKYQNASQIQKEVHAEKIKMNDIFRECIQRLAHQSMRLELGADDELWTLRERLPEDKRGEFDERCRAVRENPKDPQEYRARGVFLYNCNEYEAAQQDYYRALGCDNRHSNTYNNLGFLYSNVHNDKKKALEFYLKSIECDPRNERALNNAGNVYEQIGDADKAIQFYQKAVSVNPNYCNALNNIGFVYYNKGSFADAVEYYTQAISKDEGNALYYSNRANAYDRLGNKKEAENDRKKAEECNNNIN